MTLYPSPVKSYTPGPSYYWVGIEGRSLRQGREGKEISRQAAGRDLSQGRRTWERSWMGMHPKLKKYSLHSDQHMIIRKGHRWNGKKIHPPKLVGAGVCNSELIFFYSALTGRCIFLSIICAPF